MKQTQGLHEFLLSMSNGKSVAKEHLVITQRKPDEMNQDSLHVYYMGCSTTRWREEMLRVHWEPTPDYEVIHGSGCGVSLYGT